MPPAQAPPFRLIKTPRERGVIPSSSPDQRTSLGKSVTAAERQHWLDLCNAVESAEIDGYGIVNKIADRCPRCGTRVFRFAAESGTFRSHLTPCPPCEWAAAVALTEGEAGGLTVFTPESLDTVRHEKDRLRDTFPALHAAMEAAGTLPADSPIVQTGRYPWAVAHVARHTGPPALDLFRPVRDGRFSSGDFGTLGKASDVELSAEARWSPALRDPAGLNALAFAEGTGLIVARYEPTVAEAEGIRFHYDRPDPPRLLVDVLGLLSGGSVQVLCRRFAP